MRVLHDGPFLRVELDDAAHLLRVTRTDATVESAAALSAAYRTGLAAVPTLDRGALTLLLDMRRAPGRNDAASEAALHELRTKFLVGFARVGTLVRTAAGKLHVQRVAREDGRTTRVFTDETEALAWARSGPA